jgi:hypothetical protein
MARADSPLRERMIFLVGARRSGTNWLQRILGAHPAVAALPTETHVFNMGITPLTERFQHTNPGSLMPATMFADRDGFLDGVRDLLDRAFLDNLDRLDPSARYLVERTPWHVYDIDLIAQVYPDARVVHIIRDGRSVARSLLAKHWGPDTMEAAAQEWVDSVQAGRRGAAALGDRYREVVYEHVLADPSQEIEDLFGWLGVEFDEDVRERVLLEAGSMFNVDPGSPEIRADKWREGLSERDLESFDRVAGPLLEELGYERERTSVGTSVATRIRRLPGRLPSLPVSREAARKRLERWYARRQRERLAENVVLVERFERAVARGGLDEAVAMLTPQARVRLSDGERPRTARGAEARDLLRAALAEHESLSPRPVWGQIHSSAEVFTLVSIYDLPGNGGRWARTLVLNVADGRAIVAATLYRFRLATRPALAASGTP